MGTGDQTAGPPPEEPPLSPGSSGALIHCTIRPSRIRKFVRAVRPAPGLQAEPPGPARPVRRNSALTYGPRWSAEMKAAPQGSEALAAAASARLWITTTDAIP